MAPPAMPSLESALACGVMVSNHAPLTAKHAQWAEELKSRYAFTDSESALEVVKHEAGLVFAKGLEHCGVFGRDEKGKNEFLRFVASV